MASQVYKSFNALRRNIEIEISSLVKDQTDHHELIQAEIERLRLFLDTMTIDLAAHPPELHCAHTLRDESAICDDIWQGTSVPQEADSLSMLELCSPASTVECQEHSAHHSFRISANVQHLILPNILQEEELMTHREAGHADTASLHSSDEHFPLSPADLPFSTDDSVVEQNSRDTSHGLSSAYVRRELMNDHSTIHIGDGRGYSQNISSSDSTETHPESSIPFQDQDGVIRLVPSIDQWNDFPRLLDFACSLGADRVGVCKVLVPNGVPGRDSAKELAYAEAPSCSFTVRVQSNETFLLDRTEGEARLLSEDDPSDLPEHETTNLRNDPLDYFESNLARKDALQGVRYWVDLDAAEAKRRKALGLPELSPISSLQGDRLSNTAESVPGIHTVYNYKSAKQFGAPFAMHVEDWNLLSINYLRFGRKTVVVVAPQYKKLLENKSRQTNDSRYKDNCSQVLRHSPTYYPTAVLRRWKIPYVVLHQEPYEALIIFRNAPHQGFSHGITDAEAVNYADVCWTLDDYQECDPNKCPGIAIPRWMMEPRERRSEDRHELLRKQLRQDPSRPRKIKSPPDKVTTTKKPNATYVEARQDASKDHEHTKKKAKLSLTIPSGIEIFHSTSLVPQDMVQPSQLYQRFCSDDKYKDTERCALLTRLFFAIGSPTAFQHLRNVCAITRREGGGGAWTSINNDMQFLDKLELTTCRDLILRRYFLVRLVNRRQRLERQHLDSRPRRVTRGSKYAVTSIEPSSSTFTKEKGCGRASSWALGEILKQDYPELQEQQPTTIYRSRHRALQNRLHSGRNWYIMAERLPHALLAWIPTGEEYGISNSDIERIPQPIFQKFLDILIKLRGDFLFNLGTQSSQIFDILNRTTLNQVYGFERAPVEDLTNQTFDSLSLIEYCHAEEVPISEVFSA